MADQDIDIKFVSFTDKWHNKPYPFISPTRPELSVAGQNVVVTGGSMGIGKAIATAFAQANAASVSILGRRPDRLQATAAEISATNTSTRVITEIADVSKREAMDAALKRIHAQVGEIHIFVSNAGVLPPRGPLVGYNEKDFQLGWESNVMGAFNSIQAFAPYAAKGGAKLFNISSGVGHMAPMNGMSAYALDKLANVKLFDYVASENPDLHVVHIQPGVVATEMSSKGGVAIQDQPELPGQFLVWLSSPEANFLRGRYIWANWDAEELISRAKEIEADPLLLKVSLGGVAM